MLDFKQPFHRNSVEFLWAYLFRLCMTPAANSLITWTGYGLQFKIINWNTLAQLYYCPHNTLAFNEDEIENIFRRAINRSSAIDYVFNKNGTIDFMFTELRVPDMEAYTGMRINEIMEYSRCFRRLGNECGNPPQAPLASNRLHVYFISIPATDLLPKMSSRKVSRAAHYDGAPPQPTNAMSVVAEGHFRGMKELLSSMDLDTDANTVSEFKERTHMLCARFLGGAWKTVPLEHLRISRIKKPVKVTVLMRGLRLQPCWSGELTSHRSPRVAVPEAL
ncbi:unnamed protein product [Caenorhabditis auriculariae]|uniref:ETS domain-containing protein n=1 Tax=Caenorhabditis auriculariae TaxID=2777116 RepID=A0A8S1H2N0_9PELO|nr:unnamed protein product [Caenorhabditis auriculariae]